MRRSHFFALVVALSACTASGPSALPSVSSALPSASVTPRATPTGPEIVGLFDVGGGRKIFMKCVGSGSPTIVFLHGIGGQASHGNFLQAAFRNRVQVCIYDRPNRGTSDPVAGLQTGADTVRDLHNLLTAANIGGPYLLVAGSFGGLIGIMFAGTYPTDVVGLVMLDAALPADAEIDAILPEPDRTQVTSELSNGGERFDYSILAEAGALLPAVPDFPVTYLQATQFAPAPSGWPEEQINAMTRQHALDFVNRFSLGRLVEVDSPHFPMPDAPIIEEITRILDTLD